MTQWIPMYDKDGHASDVTPWEDVLILLGNGEYLIAFMQDDSKLRKCNFYSYEDKKYYNCDRNTPIEERITHWFPLPTLKGE